MASGKKNYFRHSFFARNDIKMRLLRDQVGIGFYFYFFSLLEQCGESCCDEFNETFVFHNSIIRSLWGVNLKKSERVANEMHAVGLLFFEKVENTFEFTIPNFAKYLGKYTNKKEPNRPNKKKRKEIKRKEIKKEKVEIDIFDFEEVYKSFPRKVGKSKGLEICRKKIGTESDFLDLKKAVDNYAKQCKTMGTEQQYIKHFSTFMNCWSDYIEIDTQDCRLDRHLIYSVICGNEPIKNLNAAESDLLTSLGGKDRLGKSNEFQVRKLLNI